MAKLTEIERWEEEIYRIEENDPVHGGENGITNKPTKQLANRTLYLRKLLTEAGQRINPKKITASSRNSNDLTGHTHEIDLASLTTKGLVQLTNDTGLDSEVLALTAKGGKAIAQSVAQLQQSMTTGLNQKVDKASISDSVSLTSQTTVASSRAVKAAYDKGVEALQKAASIRTKLIPVKGGSREVTIDATKKSDWFREMEVDGLGYYIQAFHNSGAQHNYSNFPISGRHHFIAELYHNSGYSYLRIIYPQAKRVFETSVNFNVEDLTLDWREIVFIKDGKYQGSFEASSALISGYRMRVERSDKWSPPYLQTVDMAYDLAAPPTNNKVIGRTDYYVKDGAEERSKATTMVIAYTDKNVSWGLEMWNASQVHQVAIKSFSKTNNTVIGKSTDNERDRLQVNGTVQATAPTDNADNDQLVTSGWVRRLYETAYKIDTTNQNQNLNNLLGQNKVWGVAGREANVTKLGDIYGYGVGITLNASGANAMLYIPHSRAEHNNGVWVQSSFNGNSAAPVWRRIDGADWGDIRNNPLSQSTGILHYAGNYLSVRANNSDYAGFEVVRRGNQGDFAVRYEPMPDKRIKWWVQGSHEIYMPAKGGTVALIGDIATTVKSSVVRSNKSRTINGNSTDDSGTTRQMDLVGEVIVYPDGKIEQTFHLKQFRDIWFAREEGGVGVSNSDTWGRIIPIPLWTVMPNKVVFADVQIMRSSSTTRSEMYTVEAREQVAAWAYRKQGSNKGQVWVDIARISGSHSEHIDLFVKVEGY